MMVVATIMLLAIAATACGQEDVQVGPADDPPDGAATSIQGSWTLQDWSLDGTAATAPEDPTAFVTFGADGALSGDTGCNRFGGSYEVVESADGGPSTLSITPGASTRRACTDEAASSQEQALLSLLPLVRSAQLDGAVLRLDDADGATLLTLAAGPDGLAGTSWQVTAVNNGVGGLESSELTGALTADFDATSISGSGGCNTFGAEYSAADGSISISAVTSTEIGCETDVATLESQYLEALRRSTVVELEPGSLTLRDDTGAAQVTFRPRP